jgi:hypothetical protein
VVVLGENLALHREGALQTGRAAAAPAGDELDPIQGRHEPPGHLALGARLVPFQPLVRAHEESLPGLRHQARADVAEAILTEGPGRSHRRAERGLLQLGLQLMEAREPKEEEGEEGPPHHRRRDPGGAAGVPYLGHQGGEGEDLLEGPGRGPSGDRLSLHRVICKIPAPKTRAPGRGPSAAPAQEFTVQLGDRLQLPFHPLVVGQPRPDLGQPVQGDVPALGSPSRPAHRQVVEGAMALPARALAVGLAAGHEPLHQRAPQELLEIRERPREGRAAAPESQGRKRLTHLKMPDITSDSPVKQNAKASGNAKMPLVPTNPRGYGLGGRSLRNSCDSTWILYSTTIGGSGRVRILSGEWSCRPARSSGCTRRMHRR